MTPLKFIRSQICYILLVLVSTTIQKHILWNKLIYYQNPENLDANWKCCTDGTSDCRHECQTTLTICISNTTDKSGCIYSKKTTGIYTYGSEIDFEDSFKNGQNNSINVELHELKELYYKVVAETPEGKHLGTFEVEPLKLSITSYENQVSQYENLTLNPRRTRYKPKILVTLFKLYCDQYYLLPDCQQFCQAKSNDIDGHYKCVHHVGKVCLDGWIDPQSNCTKRNESFAASSSLILTSQWIPWSFSSLSTSQTILGSSSSISTSRTILRSSSLLSTTQTILASSSLPSNSQKILVSSSSLSMSLTIFGSPSSLLTSQTILGSSVSLSTSQTILESSSSLSTSQTIFGSPSFLLTSQTILGSSSTLSTSQTILGSSVSLSTSQTIFGSPSSLLTSQTILGSSSSLSTSQTILGSSVSLSASQTILGSPSFLSTSQTILGPSSLLSTTQTIPMSSYVPLTSQKILVSSSSVSTSKIVIGSPSLLSTSQKTVSSYSFSNSIDSIASSSKTPLEISVTSVLNDTVKTTLQSSSVKAQEISSTHLVTKTFQSEVTLHVYTSMKLIRSISESTSSSTTLLLSIKSTNISILNLQSSTMSSYGSSTQSTLTGKMPSSFFLSSNAVNNSSSITPSIRTHAPPISQTNGLQSTHSTFIKSKLMTSSNEFSETLKTSIFARIIIGLSSRNGDAIKTSTRLNPSVLTQTISKKFEYASSLKSSGKYTTDNSVVIKASLYTISLLHTSINSSYFNATPPIIADYKSVNADKNRLYHMLYIILGSAFLASALALFLIWKKQNIKHKNRIRCQSHYELPPLDSESRNTKKDNVIEIAQTFHNDEGMEEDEDEEGKISITRFENISEYQCIDTLDNRTGTFEMNPPPNVPVSS